MSVTQERRASGITTLLDDEQFIHTFRQSTLSELDTCLERGRLTMSGQMPDDESDAAGVGTAVHAGIELALGAKQAENWLDLEEYAAVAHDMFDGITELPGFRYAKYTHGHCHTLIDRCLGVFDRDLYQRIEPLHLELNFNEVLIHEDPRRRIYVSGTIDCIDANIGMIDWKTAGQSKKYRRGFGGEAWMLDRWSIQGTTYAAACRSLGLIDESGPWPFTYFAFDISGAEVQLIETTILRRPQDLGWLADKCLSITRLIEADLATWPKNDNHALCSPKWCPAWASCKGAHYADVEWPLKP